MGYLFTPGWLTRSGTKKYSGCPLTLGDEANAEVETDSLSAAGSGAASLNACAEGRVGCIRPDRIDGRSEGIGAEELQTCWTGAA
jgi:hypothetical protein